LVKLLETDKLGLTTTNKEGVDLFLLSVDCEFSEKTLSYLLDKGFSVDTQDEYGRTPLHYALDLGNDSLLKYLMDHGADPKLQDFDGSSPLDEAAKGSMAYSILSKSVK
jgi:ankyrin repeat protein